MLEKYGGVPIRLKPLAIANSADPDKTLFTLAGPRSAIGRAPDS